MTGGTGCSEPDIDILVFQLFVSIKMGGINACECLGYPRYKRVAVHPNLRKYLILSEVVVIVVLK